MQKRAAFFLTIGIVVAACATPGETRSPTPTPTPAATPAPTSTPTPGATPAPTSTPGASPTSAATPDDFVCAGLPFGSDVGGEIAHIADVRVGTHNGYDRVVFEFEAPPDQPVAIPEHRLRMADLPLVQIPAGTEMEVPGDSFVHLTLLGGTRLGLDFDETYEGPLRFEPDFPQLRGLAEAGDFEATADWYIGLAEEPCLRVLLLTDPARLVIDSRHT